MLLPKARDAYVLLEFPSVTSLVSINTSQHELLGFSDFFYGRWLRQWFGFNDYHGFNWVEISS